MTDQERIDFLSAYEALGAGGLTPDEVIELAILRAKHLMPEFDDTDVVFDFISDISISELQFFMKSYGDLHEAIA